MALKTNSENLRLQKVALSSVKLSLNICNINLYFDFIVV